MKVCLTPPVAARGTWLLAGRSAAGALLLAVTVAACTGGSSSTPVFTPTPQTGGGHVSTTQAPTRTPSPSGGQVSPTRNAPTKKPTPPPTHTVTAPPSTRYTTPPPTPHPTRTITSITPTPYPTAAPQTGGGGTAGLQDGLLFGVGGAAVLAGLGSLAFRRRLRRKFAGRPAPHDPADREPADR
jgi:hypothetical protein